MSRSYGRLSRLCVPDQEDNGLLWAPSVLSG
jgi:hypothetical protein